MYVYMYVQEYATTYIMADRRMAQCMDNIIGYHTAKEREHSALPELSVVGKYRFWRIHAHAHENAPEIQPRTWLISGALSFPNHARG